jgi:hypothetical protein
MLPAGWCVDPGAASGCEWSAGRQGAGPQLGPGRAKGGAGPTLTAGNRRVLRMPDGVAVPGRTNCSCVRACCCCWLLQSNTRGEAYDVGAVRLVLSHSVRCQPQRRPRRPVTACAHSAVCYRKEATTNGHSKRPTRSNTQRSQVQTQQLPAAKCAPLSCSGAARGCCPTKQLCTGGHKRVPLKILQVSYLPTARADASTVAPHAHSCLEPLLPPTRPPAFYQQPFFNCHCAAGPKAHLRSRFACRQETGTAASSTEVSHTVT